MKHVTQRLSPGLCALVLVVLLAACGGPGGTTASTPTPPPTPTPSPTPTLAVTVFTGDGYTISYPQDWKKSSAAGQVAFQDAQGVNNLAVAVAPDPNGIAQPGAAIDQTLPTLAKQANMTNPSPANVPASVSLAGETWTQKGTTGTASKGGLSAPYEIVILATTHPASSANTKLFELIYSGPLVGSTLMDQQIFQTMLQSFKFTS